MTQPLNQPSDDPRWQNFSPQQPTSEYNGYAVASLVTGIAGFLFFPFVLHIAAIVLARVAPKKLPWNDSSRKMARAGEILGWVGLAFCVMFVLIWIILFVIIAAASNTSP